MNPSDFKERPNRVPWPPILLVLAIAIGFTLDALLPFRPDILDGSVASALGAALIVAALGLDVWVSITFRRARTTILPHRGSDALVTDGPFKFSRNPIYVGNVLILVGVGLLGGTLWHVLLVPLLVLAVTQLAIVREEAHLARRFPDAWASYSKQARRWL